MKRIVKSLISLAVVLPLPVAADEVCDDWWFTRNQIFDQTGFCFQSTLGRAIFDNGDCTTSTPKLTNDDRRKIALLKSFEKEWACKVDTTKPTLQISNLALRQKLNVQPYRDVTESACIGYKGPGFDLYAGPSVGSAILGKVPAGAGYSNSHLGFEDIPDGWWFISGVYKDGEDLGVLGWTNIRFGENCESIAG